MANNGKSEDQQPLMVRVPEHVATGVYSNLAKVNISENEIIMDFILVSPNEGEQALLVSRVILSRKHASAFLEVLDKLLKGVDKNKEDNK